MESSIWTKLLDGIFQFLEQAAAWFAGREQEEAEERADEAQAALDAGEKIDEASAAVGAMSAAERLQYAEEHGVFADPVSDAPGAVPAPEADNGSKD